MDHQNLRKQQPRSLKSRKLKFKTTPYKKKGQTNVNEQTGSSARKNLTMDVQTEYSERTNSILSEINEITGPQSLIKGFENFMSMLSFDGREQSEENLISHPEWKNFVKQIRSEMVTTLDDDQNLPMNSLTNIEGKIFYNFFYFQFFINITSFYYR